MYVPTSTLKMGEGCRIYFSLFYYCSTPLFFVTHRIGRQRTINNKVTKFEIYVTKYIKKKHTWHHKGK